ncbi:MAG: polysaccharide biosynthesis tyrosine autokinase [Pseudomonadota bacterium]
MEEQHSEQIDLRDYLRVLRKRRWTIITVFFLIVVSVTIHAFTATPIYEAATKLIIEKENPNVVSIQEVMAVDASGTDYYQTQYQIIESRSVAREVIRRLNLAESEEFFPKPADDFLSTFIHSIKETVTGWKTALLDLLNSGPKVQSGDIESDYRLVNDFITRITVEPVRNSRLVNLKFQAKDPVMASRIVATLAQAYIDQNLEIKLAAIQDAVKWLHQRIDSERIKVGAAEEKLLAYKSAQNIVTDFTGENEKITAQKLAQLNTQVVDAESFRVEAETRYRQAVALKGTPDMLDSIPEVLNNKLIMEIKGMEVTLFKRMSELSEKYGSNHPQMLAIQNELKTLQSRKNQEINRVINSLSNEYEVAKAKENSLKDALARQKRESLDLNKKAIEYTVLRREAESAREMYDLLIKRFKETSLTEDMKTGNIRIVDKAEIPQAPVKPRKKLNILLAMIVGLTLGTGLAFFFEYLDNTIKTPEEIKRYLDIPYLGPVPAIEMDGEAVPENGIPFEVETVHAPKSTASEAYRGVRTNILFSSADHEPQVLLVTSAGPQEGKTLTSVNLAVTMAQSGSRVVIIDCDLRRPKLHKMFSLQRDKGMSNLLVGNMTVKDTIVQTAVPNLWIIPSGPVPPNPSEMLGSNRMKDLLAALRKDFKRIIIDSPPISAVTDAAVLTQAIDGAVLVVRSNDKSREMIKDCIDRLKAVNAPILGAVLNGVDTGKNGYYYYQYYYYYYGEEGERKRKNRKKKRSRQPYGEAA